MSHNIYRVSLPLPYTLKQISAYVIENEGRLTIVDTGLHTKAIENAWKHYFYQKNWNWNQVEKIIVTHYHPDHYGFAGILQKWTGAPVWIAKKEQEQIEKYWHPQKGKAVLVSSFFATYGFPIEKLAAITQHMLDFRKVIEPHPAEYRWLQVEHSVEIGNVLYHIIATPGHSEGHVSLLYKERGICFAGDVLLPKITPNIPLMPQSDPNPLATFFSTLNKLNELPIKIVYPGHGEPFQNIKQRIEELKKHHDRRLQQIMELVNKYQPMSGYEICERLFSNRKLDTHNLRFAFSETISHLEFLRQSGELQKTTQNGIFVYSM